MDMPVEQNLQKTAHAQGRKSLSRAVDFLLQNIFGKAANDTGKISFNKAFDRLVNTIEKATANDPTGTGDSAEPEIREAFKLFLRSQDYRFALKNYEQLLEEKSGDKFLRDDGSTNWYHEFIPIMTVMKQIREGTLSMKAVDKYGGLETAIASHLRHDSVEDQPRYKADRMAFYNDLQAMQDQLIAEDPSYDAEKGHEQLKHVMINTGLITRKKTEENGIKIVEDVIEYNGRMVTSPVANPIVFLFKQADGVHNFATMWSPKFTPERRQKRCDEREDMYGGRHGFGDTAMIQWPDFAKAIKQMDDKMGVMLFTHARYLESVDLHYKKPHDNPVGIMRYLPGALTARLPSAFDVMDIFARNLVMSVNPAEDPAKYGRLQHFIQKNVRPRFADYADRFPILFANPQGPAPAPVAN